MHQAYAIRRQGLFQNIEFFGHRLDATFSGLLDTWINHINLPPLFEPAANKTPDLRQFIRWPQECLNTSTPRGHLVNRRQIQVSVQRQAQCARYGCCRHYQQVGEKAFSAQLFTLDHTEFMLLIDDHQAEVSGRKAGGDECMGSDEKYSSVGSRGF